MSLYNRRIYLPRLGKAIGFVGAILVLGGVILFFWAIFQLDSDDPDAFPFRVKLWSALFVTLFTSLLLLKIGNTLKHVPADDLIVSDSRPPVLYLRAFKFDDKNRVELDIANLANKFGPPVCVGKPGERFPPPGFHRLYRSDEQWQVTVEEIGQRSSLVILVIGTSAGVLWEFNRVWGLSYFRKSVLLVPLETYSEVTNAIQERFGIVFPATIPFFYGSEPVKVQGGLIPFIFSSTRHPILYPMVIWRGEVPVGKSFRLAKKGFVYGIDLLATLEPLFKNIVSQPY